MAENPDVVERADTLMRSGASSFGGRRRRSFVAAQASAAETPVPAIEDEDLPVLTDVVPAEPDPVPEPDHRDRDDERLLSIVAADLVCSIEQQLAIELPMLVEATLINAQNELRAGISSIMGMALRDFLEHRRQLRLPLDDPNQVN
jgi:hypothetical protein